MSLASLLTPHEREYLYSGANHAIWHSHNLAYYLAKNNPREEDFVATLVTNGISFLGDRWIPLLQRKKVYLKLSAVFCHGHPQVKFGAPYRKVELADLLVVHQHTKSRHTSARAILIQAKMSTDTTHQLPSSDPQLQLFSQWPPFEFVTGGLAPGLRDLQEHGKGSRYALVHKGHAYPEQITWSDQCPWAASQAKQTLTADQSFARLLGNMLLNKDGRSFNLGAPRDEWSRTIQELLKITGANTYKRKNINRGQTSRITTSFSTRPGLLLVYEGGAQNRNMAKISRGSLLENYFGDSPVDEYDGSFLKPPLEAHPEKPEGGITTLIIETIEDQG